jgi:hypothetical protein
VREITRRARPRSYNQPAHLKWSRIMAHLIDKNLIERVNAVLLLGTVWAALATCVLAALAYDIRYWLGSW